MGPVAKDELNEFVIFLYKDLFLFKDLFYFFGSDPPYYYRLTLVRSPMVVNCGSGAYYPEFNRHFLDTKLCLRWMGVLSSKCVATPCPSPNALSENTNLSLSVMHMEAP